MGNAKKNGIEVTLDIANSSFASLFEETVWGKLPAVGIAYHAWKMYQGINEYNFLKKLAAFLDNFHDCSDEFKEELRKILEERDGEDALGERVMFLLNNADGKAKARLIGKCLLAYKQEDIGREELLRFWHAIDKCFVNDLKLLKDYANGEWSTAGNFSLASVGFIHGNTAHDGGGNDGVFFLTKFGQRFLETVLS